MIMSCKHHTHIGPCPHFIHDLNVRQESPAPDSPWYSVYYGKRQPSSTDVTTSATFQNNIENGMDLEFEFVPGQTPVPTYELRRLILHNCNLVSRTNADILLAEKLLSFQTLLISLKQIIGTSLTSGFYIVLYL